MFPTLLLTLEEFRKASFFSKEGAAYFCADKYCDSFNSMSKMGSIMQGILTTSSDGDTATITVVFTAFMESMKTAVVGPMKAIGIALALLFLIISIFQLAMEDRMNPEIFVKHFAKFGLSMIAISYCDMLIDYIMQFANALASFASGLALGSIGDGIPNKATMCQLFLDGMNAGLIDQWGTMFDTLMNGAIIGLVALVLEGVSYVIAFSRMIELSVRAAGMPIAMGMLADDGWRGAGGRYIKKFIAVCCQSFVLIMIAKVSTGLMAQSLSSIATGMRTIINAGSGELKATMMGGIILSVGVGIASVTAMHKSMGLVNDMFGA